MLIVVANNKGGQGKTFIATLLTKYLASNPKNKGNILCCDLDRTQQNFKDNLADSNLPVVTSIENIDNSLLCIVDTPPNLDKDVMQAIRSADILIVPVILGKHAVQGLMRIAEIREKKDLRLKDLRLIVNEWGSSFVQKQGEEFLTEQKFKFYGKMPKYKRLAYNIDAGLDWYTGFSESQVKNITEILNDLLKR
jgi:cellulose biosynthesis protein BcsQ